MSEPITYADARAALKRLIDKAFGNPGEAPRFRIPANPTDDDLLLCTVLEQWRDSTLTPPAAEEHALPEGWEWNHYYGTTWVAESQRVRVACTENGVSSMYRASGRAADAPIAVVLAVIQRNSK